jgi:hypothetical protein
MTEHRFGTVEARADKVCQRPLADLGSLLLGLFGEVKTRITFLIAKSCPFEAP